MLAITKEFGRLEEIFSEVVYPIWPAWLAAAIIAIVVAAVVAYRLGWHEWALQHRYLSAGILAVVLVVGVPTGWYTVSPLFDRETVCEASPLAGAGAGSEKCEGVAAAAGGETGTATPEEAPNSAATASPEASSPPTKAPQATEAPQFEPTVLTQGEFVGADDFHFGRGQALLIETAPGAYALRFENFSVRNGPDLFIYLSTDPNGYSDDALLLGELKGTDGAFNYDVPPGTDVSQYKSAVVWCKAFSVLFATASFA
jgi:Electron transfer DM13